MAATITVVLILAFFLILAQIPGIGKKESAIVKENVDEYLKNDETAKTDQSIRNTLVLSNTDYLAIYSIYLVKLELQYSTEINKVISEVNAKIKKDEK